MEFIYSKSLDGKEKKTKHKESLNNSAKGKKDKRRKVGWGGREGERKEKKIRK